MQKMPSFFAVSDGEQLERLNSRLAYAARSRYYSRTLESKTRLNSLAEIETLPFLTQDDLLRHGREMLCVRQDEVRRIVSLSTSGTTGKYKRLYFSESDLQQTENFFAEGMQGICRAGERVAVLFPCASPDGLGELLSRGLMQFGAKPLACVDGAEDYGALCETLLRAEPDVLVGMPRVVRTLAVLCPTLRPRAVLLSADYVSDALRRFLAETWNCAVFAHYGMTETGYGGAVENAEHAGMLPRRDALLFEIVDASGKALPDGETGEIVLTTLSREAMPLIRYRTGDLGVMRGGKLIRAAGRIADRVTPALGELLDEEADILDYALTLDRSAGRGILSLLCIGAYSLPEEKAAALHALLPEIKIEADVQTAYDPARLKITQEKRRTRVNGQCAKED